MNSLNIYCKEKLQKAMEAAQQHNDKTLSNCLVRLISYSMWNTCDHVNLCRDWGEHCFYFEVKRPDGSLSMNGGIIFHGWPDEGYQENGSVQLTPQYGWAMHT